MNKDCFIKPFGIMNSPTGAAQPGDCAQTFITQLIVISKLHLLRASMSIETSEKMSIES